MVYLESIKLTVATISVSLSCLKSRTSHFVLRGFSRKTKTQVTVLDATRLKLYARTIVVFCHADLIVSIWSMCALLVNLAQKCFRWIAAHEMPQLSLQEFSDYGS